MSYKPGDMVIRLKGHGQGQEGIIAVVVQKITTEIYRVKRLDDEISHWHTQFFRKLTKLEKTLK